MNFQQSPHGPSRPGVLRSRTSHRGKSGLPRRHRYAPTMDMLEDRLAPAILMVTTLADSGAGSLRDAINTSANHLGQDVGNDTIQFAPALDGGTISVSSITTNNSQVSSFEVPGPSAFLISPNDTLVIDGMTNLTKGITITTSGTTPFRLFDNDGGNLTLEGLTLSGGDAQGFAGGIASIGDGTGAGGGAAGLGGAIYNSGSLTILNCTLTGNTAQGGAGGTFESNGDGGSGGGGLNSPGGAVNEYNGGVGGGSEGGAGAAGATGNLVGARGGNGGFGSGGGGGSYGLNQGGNGGNGGFGGGGGGGAYDEGSGGYGGFGGGGGGGFSASGVGSPGGYGGGSGASGTQLNTTSGGGGAAGMGGAIFNEGGNVTITNSTVAGNTASGGAGGMSYEDGAGAAGKGLGGGLFNHNGTITVINSTFSGNTAAQGGRGIFNLGDSSYPSDRSTTASATITNTIIGQSDTTGSDFVGTTFGTGTNTTSGSKDLIRTASGFAGTSVITADPLLTPLGKFGGLTQTMALLPGSPAIDAGTSTGAPSADQRGNARVGNADIGAFESNGFTIAATSAASQTTGVSTPFAALVATVTAKNASEPVAGGMVTFTASPNGGATAAISGSPAIIGADGTVSVIATANGTVGHYTVLAKASGVTNSANYSLGNELAPTFRSLSSSNITYGTSTITLHGQVGAGTQFPPNGSIVSITLNNVTQNTTVNDNQGDFSYAFSTASLSVGAYDVEYFFAGNTTFMAVTDTSTTVTVTSVTPTFGSLTSPTIPYGTATTTLGGQISAGGVYPPAGSSVSITLDSVTETTTVDNQGDFSYAFNTGTLTVGTYHVAYSFGAIPNFGQVTDTSTNLTVASLAPTFSVASQTIPSGTPTTTLSGHIGSGSVYLPEGSNLSITLNNVTQSTTVIDAQGDFTDAFSTGSLPVGTYSVTYAFGGNTDFLAATDTSTAVTVASLVPTFTVTSQTISYGTSTTTLSGQIGSGLAYPPEGSNVLITLNSVPQSALVDDDQGDFTSTFSTGGLTVGVYPVTYSFAGDATFAAATDTSTTVTVASAASTFTNLTASLTNPYGTSTTTLSGQISAGATYPPQGSSVLITLNSATQSALVNDAQGHFTSAFSTGNLPVGTYQVTYDFAGNTNFDGITDSTSTTVTVSVATPAFSDLTSPTIAEGAATTTLTGHIGSGAAYPTGEVVSITLNGVTESAQVDGNGNFTYPFSTGSLAVAGSPYPVTYAYAGDGNLGPATDMSTTVSAAIGNTNEVQTGGLDFRTIGGGTFSPSGNTYRASSPVEVGYLVSGTFIPLLGLSGTTTIDPTTQTFSSTGTVTSVVNGSGLPLPLLSSISAAPIADLTGSGITGLAGASFTVAGVGFTLDSLAINSSGGVSGTPQIQLQGSLALPDGLTVAVNGTNFVDIDSSQISLTGISASLTGSLTVGGVSFDLSQLTVGYSTQNNEFTVTGDSSVTVTDLAGLEVDFGGDSTAGLVITNGSLTSLDTTVTSNFTVAGVTFSTTGLEFTYTASTGEFSLTGAAGVTVAGLGNLTVSFGHGTNPGLDITAGALTGLDMTVDSNISVESVIFNATGLEFSYTDAGQVFQLQGTAGVTVGGITGLSVNFVGAGLVITDGSLTSLDMSVTSSFSVDSVTFSTTGLTLLYTASPQAFQLTGSAALAIGNIDNVSVSFVGQGLVISGGSLQDLDMSLTSNIQISKVTFGTQGLTFDYTAASDDFQLSGVAAVTVGGMANLSVTFGNGTNPGLDITAGALTELDMTVDSNISVDSVMFHTTGLEFTYTDTDATPVFSLTGTAGVTVGGIADLSVNFAGAGLVITGGALTSLDMSVTSEFAVDGVTFSTTGLTFDYTASPQAFQLTGAAALAIGKIDNVSVEFVGQGLVISGGSLQVLDMSVTSDIQISKVTFGTQGLTFDYTAATDTFQLTGTAFVTVNNIDNLSVNFANQGLVISNGNLVSLDVSVTSSFKVGKVTFGTQGLEFSYVASTDTYQLTGTAFVMVGGIQGTNGDQLSVTFVSPGLVISNGSLVSLDVSVTSSFKVGKVTFGTKDLEFSYVAAQGSAPETFQLTGTAFVVIGGIQGVGGDQVSVTFANQGLVISNGSLVSLDVSVTSSFKVGKVMFGTDGLELSYVVATDTFQLTGAAFVTIGGIDGVGGNQVSVDFANDGLLITNGSLVSLDMSLTSNITISKVTFGTDGLDFKYTTASDTFQLTGTAFVTIGGFHGVGGSTLSVTFANDGLLLVGGNLVSLDVAVTSTFLVGPATFGTKNLEFSYVVATDTFQLTGTAFVNIGGIQGVPGHEGNELDVTFANNGMVITNGALVSVDVALNSSFMVGTATITTNNLEFSYVGATNVFTLSGTAGVSAFAGLAQLNVNFGYTTPTGTIVPGLVINTATGSLTSLNMSVTSTVGIGTLGFHGDLVFSYTASNQTFIMTGDASVTLPTMGSLQVDFGGTSPDGEVTQGLLIQNGVLKSLNMTAVGNFAVGGVTFAISDFIITYTTQPGQSLFTLTGDASLTLPDIGRANVDFGGPGTQGISVLNGTLTTFNMTVDANFSLAGIAINGNLIVSYQSSPSEFTMTGMASATFLGTGFTVDLGGAGTQGMVIQNDTLTSFDMTLDGQINIVNVLYVDIDTNITYNNSLGEFTLSGNGAVSLQVPSSLQFAMGNTLVLAQVGYNVVDIANDKPDSYVQFYTTVLGISVGIKVNFNGAISLDPGIDVLQSIENGLKDAEQAIVSGWNTFASWFGPLGGATVYYDANNNFDFAHDPSAVTASNGTFQLNIPTGSTTGQIVVVGGVDQSTGLVNAAILTAPLGATTITPLSTLVNDIEQQTGASGAAAIGDIQHALGLSTTINPLSGDYIKEALAGDADAAGMFAAEVQLTALSYQVDAMLSAAGGGTPASISTHLFNNLASIIVQSGGAPFNLTDPAVVQALIQTTAANVNGSLNPTIAAGAATIVAGVNQHIAALPVAGSVNFLNQVVQAQVVAENTVAPLLAQAVAGSVSIDTVVAEETGTPLASQVAAALIGSVDLDGPTVVIVNQVQQPVGHGDPTTMQFSVYLATTAPLTKAVSVSYTTRDITATAAHGDYTPQSGTLTWQPGDTAPKTITVPIYPSSTIAADKLFDVVVSNPVNASIESAVGVGDIQFTDIATTTALTTSTAHSSFGIGVTLTATVRNRDATNDDGTGSVTFYDGTTALGTSPLVNGVATLMSTALNSGSHAISATYIGHQELGENFDPSNSAVVSLTVSPATQTIDFGTLVEQTYGAAPMLLSATASSGQPVTFRVMSGPAILVGGDLLTMTGAGVVRIEADQGGNVNYEAAPSFVQSFTVNPALLTFAANNQVMTYGGMLPTLSGSFTSGFVNGDSPGSLTSLPTLSTVAANSHAGAYSIVASGAVDPNYTVIYVPGTLTITPATLAITADDQNMIYGGTLPTLTASFSGLVNGDTPSTVAGLALATVSARSHVGSYAITESGATDSDYRIILINGTLTITPAPLIITAEHQSMVISSALPALTASYAGLVNGDTSGTLTTPPTVSTTVTSASPIGFYVITADNAVDTDYAISYVDGTLNVALEAPVTDITTSTAAIVYGQSITLTASVGGDQGTARGSVQFRNGGVNIGAPVQLSGGTASLTTTALPAGSDAITAYYTSDSNNYTDGSNVTPLTENVGRAILTITAQNNSKTYGSTASDTGTISGVEGSDGITATFSSAGDGATAAVGTGNYTIVAVLSDPNDTLGNYTIQETDATLTVYRANATVVVTPYTVTYNGAPQTATVTSITGVNGETGATVGTVTLNTTNTNAGIYANDSWSFTSANYNDIDRMTITDAITPAVLTVTGSGTQTYGGSPSFTAAYNGFVLGQNSSVLGGAPAFRTTATSRSDVGTYTAAVTPSGLASSNYAIVYVNGTLTVRPATLTITADNASKTYGTLATFSNTTFTETGLVTANGDTITSVTMTSAGMAATAHVAGSPYTIVPGNAVGNGLGNYAIAYHPGSLTVNPASLTIVASNKTMPFGATVPTLSVSYSGFVNGDTPASLTTTAQLATSATSNSPEGAYPITVSGASSSDYAVRELDGTLTVASYVPPDRRQQAADEFVTTLYNDILGREPDPLGLQYWMRRYSGGRSTLRILHGLADSTERRDLEREGRAPSIPLRVAYHDAVRAARHHAGPLALYRRHS
jgi:hypothetical protein